MLAKLRGDDSDDDGKGWDTDPEEEEFANRLAESLMKDKGGGGRRRGGRRGPGP